jgi:hypothetical protein
MLRHLAVGTTRARRWLQLSIAIAILAASASVIGLVVDRVYGEEKPELVAQALAQDAVNLAIVSPALVLTALLSLRGSLRAYLVWLGLLAFTAYNYMIYTVGIHFGFLFLPWVAILGISLYTLVAGLALIDWYALRAAYIDGSWRPVAAWFLVVVGSLFALLWLTEIVPATVNDEPLQSARDVGWPSNIVHVLDLAFFMPAVVVSGLLLRRGRPLAYASAPALLVFLIATSLPIMATPVVKTLRDEPTSWAVLGPIGIISLGALWVLVWSLRHLAAAPHGHG